MDDDKEIVKDSGGQKAKGRELYVLAESGYSSFWAA